MIKIIISRYIPLILLPYLISTACSGPSRPEDQDSTVRQNEVIQSNQGQIQSKGVILTNNKYQQQNVQTAPVKKSLALSIIKDLRGNLDDQFDEENSKFALVDTKSSTSSTGLLTKENLDFIIINVNNVIAKANLYNSTDMNSVVTRIVEGAESSLSHLNLDSVVTVDVIETIVDSLQNSVKSHQHYLELSSDVNRSQQITRVLSSIAQTAISHLDLAGLMGDECERGSNIIIQTEIANLDEFKSINADHLEEIISSIVEGAIKGVDDSASRGCFIESATMVKAVVSGAVNALDDIEIEGYNSSDLENMASAITTGATKALNEIDLDGNSSSSMADMLEAITSGATSSLDDIKMVGYDSSDLGNMLSAITAGAARALNEIEMENVDPSGLGNMLGAITSGAAESLNDIEMKGYDSLELGDLLGAITAGATSVLDNVDEGYDSSDMSNIIGTITSGATGVLNDGELEGFDVNDESAIENIYKKISSSVTKFISTVLEISNPTITIDNGNPFTKISNIELTLSAEGYYTQMYITSMPDCNSGGNWLYYRPKNNWSLSSNQLNSTVTIYVKLRNETGFETDCISDSIIHDDISPSIIGLSDDTTVHTSKTWSWECNDSSCAYRYIIDNNSDTTIPTDIFVQTNEVTHNEGDGVYYLHIQAKDAVGNLGEVEHVSAIFDNTAPSLISILPSSGFDNPTHGPEARFTVKFSENVYNVSSDDFSLAITGATTGMIDFINPISSSEYDVYLHSVEEEGVIQLNIIDDSDIADQVGLQLTVSNDYEQGELFVLPNSWIIGKLGLDPTLT